MKPGDVALPRLTLVVLPDVYAVCQLPAGMPAPAWTAGSPFVALVHTAEEVSLVCCQRCVPPHVTMERDWRCLRVDGPLDFALVGVLAALVMPLARAGVSVFTISSYITDYLLVRDAALPAARAALQAAGHHIHTDAQTTRGYAP